jgi:hypothetical protein
MHCYGHWRWQLFLVWQLALRTVSDSKERSSGSIPTVAAQLAGLCIQRTIPAGQSLCCCSLTAVVGLQ